ncbi:MAG TPA: VOC family protein [Terriglobales bacterium]|nr:VOC family protein [Terriglobales bacterium]
MKKLTIFKAYMSDQEDARKFYVNQLGFKLAEDKQLGDYRWLLVQAPDNREVSLNLEVARTAEEIALIGRQAAAQPLFSLCTDDGSRDLEELKRRDVGFDGKTKAMFYGTGVMMRDLYGNRIYLNQEPSETGIQPALRFASCGEIGSVAFWPIPSTPFARNKSSAPRR